MARQRRAGPRPPWVKGSTLWMRPGREHSGVVFVIRKLLGKAVHRNRLKRRLRSLCRDWETTDGGLVVMPQPEAMQIPYRDLERELTALRVRLNFP